MRTIIDIPIEQVQALEEICERENISRAEAIRRAIAGFLSNKLPKKSSTAFGIWKDRKIDGLSYQEDLRAEWGK